MWLRHALKLLLTLLFLSACSPHDRQAADKLNSLSYAYHYRSLDSTEAYARRAYALSEDYEAGRAEAVNHLAFVNIARMRYDEAREQLLRLAESTDNQIELLAAEVQLMRLCQRESQNRAFHEHRMKAERAMKRIEEEALDELTEHERLRWLYAKTEYAIVNSTYYYYVGLQEPSVEALAAVGPEVAADTAQLLGYLYNIGAGGILRVGATHPPLFGTTQATGDTLDVARQEIDCLLRCYQMAVRGGYAFFTANAAEALAEHLADPALRDTLIHTYRPGLSLVAPHTPDSLLSEHLAREALELFAQFGDIYQTAGAHRTLATAYHAGSQHAQGLEELKLSLADDRIFQAPDLVASIYEQLSVAYAALGDKPASDQYRNQYLDLQEQTRQDRSLEARAASLEYEEKQLNLMLTAIAVIIVLLLVMVMVFSLRRPSSTSSDDEKSEEHLREQLARNHLDLAGAERALLEQRAQLSLVQSIAPLIDRVIHAASRQDFAFADELLKNIEQQNEVLTQWIQLRQGHVSLHIESFPLQPLLDLVGQSRHSFTMKGVSLSIGKTEAVVKADRTLTLFMLNTLIDNARKFTTEGQSVSIDTEETPQYVEIAVSDTGCGMSQWQADHLFDRGAPLTLRQQGGEGKGHGFGLLNCMGIINQYRKMSHLFNVCEMTVRSREGEGTRIAFRLPRGVRHALMLLALFGASLSASATTGEDTPAPDQLLAEAAAYADSAYFANVSGRYREALLFADSARTALNSHYLATAANPTQPVLMATEQMGGTPAEITWYHEGVETNFDLILDIRNEAAVAALALNEWKLYAYNNRIYTQLYKEMSADNTLADYCLRVDRSRTDKTIALILLVVLALSILPAYWLLVFLPGKKRRDAQRRRHLEVLSSLTDEVRQTEQEVARAHVVRAVLDNCLSALKHETMYYPSRLRQLLAAADGPTISETAQYYRQLYGLLTLQAVRQTEAFRLTTRPLPHHIQGNDTLLRYLDELIDSKAAKPVKRAYEDEGEEYVSMTLRLPAQGLSPEEAKELFTPTVDHIPYLLCRQIVRDHGEATHRRACGIKAVTEKGDTVITVLLPQTAHRKP